MIDSLQPTSLGAMLLIGLLGAGHCAGMCGGIATALGLATQSRHNITIVTAYNIGRITTYACAGFIAGGLSYWGTSYLLLAPWLRLAAGILLILMGLYLANWWRALVVLEKLGSHWWRRLQPIGNRLLPVSHWHHALLLGLIWGWLPCGLVYSALAYALTAKHPAQGGLMMIAFGLGTAPAMVAGGYFAQRARRLLQAVWLRRIMGTVLIGFGIWTVYTGLSVSHQH